MSSPSAAVEVWDDVVGQDHAVAELKAALAQPVHAYLFVGPRGSGKRAAARAFAAELLSEGSEGEAADRHRRLALAEQHPDLVVADPEGARLSAETARGIVAEAARSPVEGDRKVILLCELHRIEMYEFPGMGRLFMVRFYTRRYFQRTMGSDEPLERPSMTMDGRFCR